MDAVAVLHVRQTMLSVLLGSPTQARCAWSNGPAQLVPLPPLLTVKFAVMTVVAPEVSVMDAVIECAPLARFAVLYGFAAETAPPAKSHGALLSVHVGVPLAGGLSR